MGDASIYQISGSMTLHGEDVHRVIDFDFITIHGWISGSRDLGPGGTFQGWKAHW